MAEIQIARIDYRLIHGQVVTKWMKAYPAKRIVIVDTVKQCRYHQTYSDV